MKKISQIPKHERPREKLKMFGPRTLPDSELMGALLGSGSARHGVLEWSGKVLRMIDESRRRLEHLLCASLSGAGEVIACRVVTIGLVDRVQVHPREAFAAPIIDRASAVIIAHNHPMGPLEPSYEDREITRTIKAAGKTLGIWLLDHIIFNKNGHYSFMEHDEMESL